MGLFDSLFGSDTVETNSQTDSKVRFPIQFRDLATAVGQIGSGLAGTDPNNMIAGFSPDQLAAFQALRDMATTDPTGYFDVINQLQQEGLSAGDNDALTSGLTSLTNLIQTSQDNPTVSASIDKLMQDANVGDVNAADYRAGVDTDTVTAPEYSTSAIQDVMNPYQQQVIDQFNQNFNAQADRTRAASARERAGRRAFGTRADLAETEEDKNLLDSYNTALGNLLSTGFTNAQQQFNANTGASLEAQKANQSTSLSAASQGLDAALKAEQGNQAKNVDLAKLGQTGAAGAGQLALDQSKLGADLSTSLTAAGIDQGKLALAGAQAAGDAASQERATAIGNAGLISNVGDAYQNQQQQALDAPWTQMDRLAGVLAGVPTTASSTTTGTAPSGNPSPISQLAGAGLTAYGLFSGSADGGVVKGGLDGKFLSPRGLKRGFADGGQVGVKATEPRIGEHDPRFATSLTDDTWYARDLGFDLNDPEFYGGALAADIGANPFYSPNSVLGDYRYSNQLPSWGAMPMLPENGMPWQFVDDGGGDPRGGGIEKAARAIRSGLQGNPFLGMSLAQMAPYLEDPSTPESVRQQILDVVQMYLDTDNVDEPGRRVPGGYAEGGEISVNPYLGVDPDRLIAMLQAGGLTENQRGLIREALMDTMAAERRDYDQPSDLTGAMGELESLARRRAIDAAGSADMAAAMGEPADAFRDEAAIADYDARRYGTTGAAAGSMSSISASPLDDPMRYGAGAEWRSPQPLVPATAVPMADSFSMAGPGGAAIPPGALGPYMANDPRTMWPRTAEVLDTGLPLIDSATGSPPAIITGAGSPYDMPERRATSGPGWYGSRDAGSIDFSQPGSMIQAVESIVSAPSPTGVPTSSGTTSAPASASGVPSSAAGIPGAGAPPFTPPIPMRPPARGEADAAAAATGGDWLDRAMNNPYVQLGLALMGSRQQGLFPALAEAGNAVIAQRQSAADRAWERAMKEREIAVDEGGLAVRQAALAAELAGRSGRGGGGRGGSGGGGSSGSGVSVANAADALSLQLFGVTYSQLPADAQKTVLWQLGDPTFRESWAAALGRDPSKGDDANYLVGEQTATDLASSADDWLDLSPAEQIRRIDAIRRGQDPTAGGFGGLGGLQFYGATAAPPPPAGFVLE